MSDPSGPLSPTGKHPILLVDDEPEILFSLKGLLRREYELYTAQSGKEALEILQHHPVHVIMTDQRMPEMTGVELMGVVKNRYPEAVRIIFTGYADIRAVVDAINNGGLFRYITKPWDPDDLLTVLQEATSAYERIVERRQLLADVHQYVQDAQQMLRSTVGSVTAGDRDRWNKLVESGDALVARLDRASQDDSFADPCIK